MGINELNFLRGYLVGQHKTQAAKALNIAEKCHAGQVRRGNGEPYVYHPIQVASLLISLGVEKDEIIAAAILHDILEDCRFNLSYSELKAAEISEKVLEAVLCVTKDRFFKKTDSEYEIYYNNISKNDIACLVKIADRCQNLATMAGAFSKEKKLAYIAETRKYIIPLLKTTRWTFPEYVSPLYTMKFIIDGICNNIEDLIEIKNN